MKPGDHVIWLHSPGGSFLTGWRLQQVPGVVMRICRPRIRIRIRYAGEEKFVIVNPGNVIQEDQNR